MSRVQCAYTSSKLMMYIIMLAQVVGYYHSLGTDSLRKGDMS